MSEKPGLISRFRRSELEKTTDSCSVCGEEINFFGMYHHMKTKHPEHLVSWLLWAAAVILSFVLPVAILLVLLIFVGGQNALLVILGAVAMIVALQWIVGRIGKNWERRVSTEWQSAHPLRNKKQSKKGGSP